MKTLYKNPNYIEYLICIPSILNIGLSIYSLITHDFPKLGLVNGVLLLTPITLLSSYKSSKFKSIVKFYTLFFIVFSIPYLYLAFNESVIDKISSLIYSLTVCVTYIVIKYLNNKKAQSTDDSNIR